MKVISRKVAKSVVALTKPTGVACKRLYSVCAVCACCVNVYAHALIEADERSGKKTGSGFGIQLTFLLDL